MSLSLQKEVDIPVIDISQFPSDYGEGGEGLNKLHHHSTVATVRDACKELGFFRVVNTGIPTELLQNVENVIHELYAMPAEAKERAVTSNPVQSYMRSLSQETFCLMKMPRSDSLHETIGTYTLAMADLQQKISKIIIASLGLDVTTFFHSDFQHCEAYMRLSRYSSNGRFTEDEGALFEHTDLACFTILYQTNEGLQIRTKEGKWLNVKPIASSFVINVGDSLQAWTNRRFRSAEHRVVFRGWTDRLSIAWFVHFPYDKEIWAPAEFVDANHPRYYRPFTFSQFKHYFDKNFRPKGINLLNLIDSYAGIPTV
ncbi:2-oxoglutarate-dependent dioxygenase DAO-like [Cryptomeria japonica]|uniref:2-oxoglutarate-dependent dioxygenase DAO-like n=1 Tax=Cryptomeria japonica TaxID=3369 RepID=UPI0027D9FA21|nr:2-oxoglutarate-dependent dioxygenase DAO-like [Cryptomeria japonica]